MMKWEYQRIGDVCTVERGGSPRPIDEYITKAPDGINWIKIGDTTDSMYITQTEQKIRPEGMKKSRFVHVGDFLLSNSMSFGRPYILAIDGCIHDGWLVLHDDENRFDKRFLYYFLSAPMTYQKFEHMAVGGVVNNLNSKMVRNLEVPVPSRAEQQDIADRLDCITEIISNRKRVLALLDELVKSRFVEMFGDPIVNDQQFPVMQFSEIASSRLGKMLDKKNQTGKCAFPYLANYNVQWFRFDLSSLHEMDFTEADRQEFELRKGDLLVCEGGEVGRCAIWNNELEHCYFQKALHRVRCDTSVILPEYMAYTFFLHSQYNGFEDAISGVSTIAHLPGDRLKKLRVIVPPLPLQQKFAAFVHQVDAAKAAAREEIAALETLRGKMMQEFFG